MTKKITYWKLIDYEIEGDEELLEYETIDIVRMKADLPEEIAPINLTIHYANQDSIRVGISMKELKDLANAYERWKND